MFFQNVEDLHAFQAEEVHVAEEVHYTGESLKNRWEHCTKEAGGFKVAVAKEEEHQMDLEREAESWYMAINRLRLLEWR